MYEYAVIIRRTKRGEAPLWQLWVGSGKVHEEAGFLAVMDHAGALGFEAFAAGNFDEVGVPEVLLKRAVAVAPPPPVPRAPASGQEPRAAAPAAKGSSKPKPKAATKKETKG